MTNNIEVMEEPKISKTRKKKEMQSLKNLGQSLLELPIEKLEILNLPDNLLEALTNAHTTKKRGAKRRQLQLIGKLMRHIDTSHIKKHLNLHNQPSSEEIKVLHTSEMWRKNMIENDKNIKEFITLYPNANTDNIQSLVDDCRQQKNHHSAVYFRRLFREISEVVRTSTADKKICYSQGK